MGTFETFDEAVKAAWPIFPSTPIETGRWQGLDISDKPEMQMHEVMYYDFKVALQTENLEPYRQDIKPNLPWADDHFKERVCGYPINPGVEWANWGNSDSAETFLEQGKFNHNYMERYWPRHAGYVTSPTGVANDYEVKHLPHLVHQGIRHEYGDLEGVVRHLAKHPLTRQAYLPVWFPEDTGDVHEDRKPCTLGYHFMMRNGKLNIVYDIRSCDYVRHFRDDIYLTVRLLLWVLEECRTYNPEIWMNVVPGTFIMHISSLHMFRNDYIMLKNDG